MTAHSSTQLRVVATQLGTTAQGLRSRSQHHRLVGTEVGSTRRELTAAWSSPAAAELGGRLDEVVSSVSAARDPLDHAATVLGELADQATSLAAQLSTAENNTASLERQLQQNGWAPDPDPVAAERLRGQLSATRQQSVRAQQQWEAACSRSQSRMQPALDALRAALRGLPTIPRPSRTSTAGGRGSLGIGSFFSRLRAVLRAGLEASAPLLRWMERLPRPERRQPPSPLPMPPILTWPPYLVGRGLGERLREGARDTVGTLGAAGATLLGAALRGSGSLSSVGGELGRIAAERLPLPNADLLRAGVEWASGAWQMAGSALSSAWRATTGVVTGAWNWATNTVSSAWRWSVDTVRDAWQFGTSAVSSAWNWATGTARDVGRGVVDLARGARDLAVAGVQATGQLAVDAWQGLTSAASAAWDWTADLVGSTLRAAAEAADRAAALLWGALTFCMSALREARFWLAEGGYFDWRRREEFVLNLPVSPIPNPFDDADRLVAAFAANGLTVPTTPAEAAAVFAGLDEDQAMALVLSFPEFFGSLDGVPSRFRHEANLLVLNNQIDNLAQRIKDVDAQAEMLHSSDSDGIARLELERQSLMEQLLTLMRLWISITDDPNQHLLVFRPETGGVALANGDLADATSVSLFVPGTGAGLGNVTGYLDDHEPLHGAVDEQTPGGNHVSVVWIDYQAPPTIAHATDPTRALAAAPSLERFIQGVVAENGSARTTLWGHSYGSSTIGVTLRITDIEVDAAILLAPPGAFAGHVSDYETTATVYVGTSDVDVIHLASGHGVTANLGPDPTTASFGAERLDVSTALTWHPLGGYLDDSEFSAQIAEIVVGSQ